MQMEPTRIRGMTFLDTLGLGSPRSCPITTLAGEYIWCTTSSHRGLVSLFHRELLTLAPTFMIWTGKRKLNATSTVVCLSFATHLHETASESLIVELHAVSPYSFHAFSYLRENRASLIALGVEVEWVMRLLEVPSGIQITDCDYNLQIYTCIPWRYQWA
jgi:hypothetical protein